MFIGLSQRILTHKQRAYDSIEHGWYSYLKEHTLFFLPNFLEQDFEKRAHELDAFIITGGDDHPLRRTTELRMATAMMRLQKPILGVCHGVFLLTDILGGYVGEIEGHRDTEHLVHSEGHVQLVNSHHSLSITKTHSTAQTIAVDEDGNTEAWIDGNVAGIVWHPERMTVPYLPNSIANLLKL